ncbi:DUF4231 domain-containing protein [Asanoa sp. NPDC049573]|uniref:DUF4231 domain-containing protein n=1 Tax=Asanoa sp. NPDC049573 TaxID=3155396 RepID=UPI0034405A26
MTTPTLGRGTAEWAWDQQSRWSQAADAAKAAIVRSRVIVLVLTLVAASAGTVGSQVDDAWSKVLAGVAAVTLAASSVLIRGTSAKKVAEWTRIRSVSEALKAEVYHYQAGVAPYRDANRADELERRTSGSIDDAGDLVARSEGFVPVARPLPAVSDVTSYARERVEKQLNGYYRPKAKRMRVLAARYVRTATVASVAVAAASALSVAVDADLSVWVAVVTTFSASLLAFSTAQRYSYQQLEFSRTATQLDRLLSAFHGADDPERADRFVAECERVISVSNEAWMAKQVETDERTP